MSAGSTWDVLAPLVAILALVGMLVVWVAVQRAWLRVFSAPDATDALAARDGCGRCGCAGHSCPSSDDFGPSKRSSR